ncbi:6-phosphogluconolactonase [Robiginitalea sp. SC105]|uniref:6-phosphogluconolactonase n=1 Tax=Robiginitalea sp. SC105 TaxID=2762332 RepID=UPI00163A52D2|nr:6-phosphogluconolactonase [Robiginitalea sp. SC105]MBC2839452.1 6-phosphogluconolactonase [Robiginitalea sp. SC105]
MEIQVYPGKQEAAEALAEQMAEWAREGSMEHIALSGGSTPEVLFDTLAEDYWFRLPWKEFQFYWGDERCVPPTDPQSNFRMTREHLFDPLPIPDAHIHRIRGEAQPAEEATRYEALLRSQLPLENGLPRFDLILLGMGDDGHTASVFPHQAHLWDSKNLCEVAQHPESGQLRVTLTGGIINNAARIVFLVTGAGKAGRVADILGGKGDAAYPAGRVAPGDGRLIWILDEAAASGLLPDMR